MTEEQKKLEKLLLDYIEEQTKAACEVSYIHQTAMALIELWKITRTKNFNVINEVTRVAKKSPLIV